jgi:hypothetical protein
MRIALPSGTTWHHEVPQAAKKLGYRAQLPGARVFDLAGESLRAARARGVDVGDCFTLALPASWLVNSPAISRVLRRWALEPHRETCLALIELVELGREGRGRDPETENAMRLAIRSLGDEPYVVEALSKVLALLASEDVPLMPPLARAFALGEAENDHPDVFARMVEWFSGAVIEHQEELLAIANAHAEVKLTPGGVLDRLLWFDSDGHKHFPPVE